MSIRDDDDLEQLNTETGTSTATEAPATQTDSVDDQFTKVFGALDEIATKAKTGDESKTTTTSKATVSKDQTGDKRGATRQGSDSDAQPQEGYKPVIGMRGHFIDNKNGNIVNAAGDIIAHRGRERERLLNDLKSVENIGEYRKLRAEHEQFKTLVDTYKSANLVADKAGLSAQEILFGMNVAAAWKSDRKATLTQLLTAARERGDTLEELNAGGGIDINALKTVMTELIKEHLAPFNPFVEDRRKQDDTARMKREIDEEIAQFYADYPDSQVHRDEIASIINAGIEREQPVTLPQAYVLLARYAAENQLDFTKPLQPQLAASGDDTNIDQTPRRRGTPPMRQGGGSNGTRRMEPRLADPDASYDSILRDVLSEQGAQR